MKQYLSFGGGVNSVAMMLMLLEQKKDFETIFVDHGTDWTETYEYLGMFQGWLEKNGHKPITILNPKVPGLKKSKETFSNLYDYYYHYRMVPSFMMRICTDKFKIRPIYEYVDTPCFMMLGIDAGESKRAKISSNKGVENRFPLIENEINREGCKQIILDHGLPVPMKSGCYICPFQREGQWIELRRTHPDLFCKAQKLEQRNMQYRESTGKKPFTLNGNGELLKTIVDEDQLRLFKDDQYPPCECEL
ncbi:MAG: phosphoadenosine phosphosulfate reductase family protein [Desulfobacterales bacterium]|nr:phosphoadenosine phosphosulfate reductase family protein [Desulfobacterales bacterium]